jgi:Tfp pilus assembly protein PilF
VQQAIDRSPDAWQGYYNSACIEARFGDKDKAIAQLRRSAELDPEATRKAAENDKDLDSIRERPDYPS